MASQEIIKELGTNGGGFFNTNSAMPFENPNGLTNFLEMLAILVIPASLTYTYGRMVGSRRQGWTIFGAMFVLFAVSVAVVYIAESSVTPAQAAAGLTGANLEGKELRFGTANSALWTAVTTVTSCGAVNAAFESLTGIGGLVPMVNMGYGESVFGGVGTGLYTMLLYVLLAVFIGGLMVGRTPEYLGKKLEAREVKLIVLGLLFTPLAILMATSLAIGTKYGAPSIFAERPAGLLGDALRLPVAGQQQRLGVRRLHGLLPARAGQHRRPRDHVRRPARRHGDDARALHPDRLHARRRRRDGAQAGRPRRPRDDAHRHADLRRPADRHRRADRRSSPSSPPCCSDPTVQGLTDRLF